MATTGYRDGSDLIMGMVTETSTFTPLGHSTGCSIDDKSETGDRTTKEASTGKWKEKYVKSLAESISADGFEYNGDSLGFPKLKELWLAATPVKLRYAYRGEEETTYYEGMFIISSLKQDAKAGDDTKWSVSFDNTGAITPKPTV